MSRLDKLEVRARELHATLDDFVRQHATTPSHQFWKARAGELGSKSKLDDLTSTMIRTERDLKKLNEQLARPSWIPPTVSADSGPRFRSDIKVNSIPRDYRHVIDEKSLREAQRNFVNQGLRIFERIHFSAPLEEVSSDCLVLKASWNMHLDEVHLQLIPWPETVLDNWVIETFKSSILPDVLAFQLAVRQDPQQFKKSHHELKIWWRETWFESEPESLPNLEQML